MRLLGWLAAAATRWPKRTLAVLAAGTVAMAALATSLSVEVDLTQLGSEDSDAAQAMDRIRAEFADPTAVVQVILDAGLGADILDANRLAAIRAVERVAVDTLGANVRTDDAGRPQLLSPAAGVEDQADEVSIGRALAANPQLAGLLSDDLDVDAGTARAAVVVVPLDPGLTEPERTEAGERVRAALDREQDGVLRDLRVTVFSNGLFVAGLLDAIRAEVPLLFGLALLVVLTVLALMYRSLFDVAVGFVGLVGTVVWTLGLAALLGPAYLGWTGPLTQFVVVIPVLLAGLGIDYSVHLVARYREQRAAGQTPAAAGSRALHTVGATLVLATAATSVGFGSIAVAPLQMLADFGVFIAVGVICAFLIMSLGVPAARVWRDQRSPGRASESVRELRIAPILRAPAWLARRAPAAGLAAGALLAALSLLAATGLEVEFDRDDFIPEGSDIEAVLAHQAELFGGGVTESTFVLIDGDLTDPAVANALWDAQTRVGRLDWVRSVADTPQILSVLSMVAGMTAAAPPQAPTRAWTGNGFAADADIQTVYGMLRQALGDERVGQVLTPDARAAVVQIRTTAGDAGAHRLQREVGAAFAPVEQAGAAVTVTSEPIIVAEMSEDLSAFQIQAIGLTLAVVLVLLTAYYAFVRRRGLLGVIALIPAVTSAALILGMMWLLGISFNVLTATLTAIAIGIGVPYGVHVVNRFAEEFETEAPAVAAARTLHATGAALTCSALTTLGAFVVLAFSNLPPMRSLGLLGGTGIAFALLAALFVEPGGLVLWANRQASRAGAPTSELDTSHRPLS